MTQNRADSGSNAKIMRPVNRKLFDIGGEDLTCAYHLSSVLSSLALNTRVFCIVMHACLRSRALRQELRDLSAVGCLFSGKTFLAKEKMSWNNNVLKR